MSVVMIDAVIPVEVLCDKCGQDLSDRTHAYSLDQIGDPIISIEPCPNCLEEALELLKHEIVKLSVEVDRRIEHGAESGGHLEYVDQELLRVLQEAGQ